MPIYRLTDSLAFPDPQGAEDGIVAVGGDLSPDRLIRAYQVGIFPWYNIDEPILWWSPDPRCVLYPSNLRISKSMHQILNQKPFSVSFDKDFKSVMKACAEVRYKDRTGTWINDEMIESYTQVHRKGLAHSVEVRNRQGELVGGLYGLSMGSCFFGESMFHKVSNASKYAFIALVKNLAERSFKLIDCQVYNPHLESLGAINISRAEFLKQLKINLKDTSYIGSWKDWQFNQ